MRRCLPRLGRRIGGEAVSATIVRLLPRRHLGNGSRHQVGIYWKDLVPLGVGAIVLNVRLDLHSTAQDPMPKPSSALYGPATACRTSARRAGDDRQLRCRLAGIGQRSGRKWADSDGLRYAASDPHPYGCCRSRNSHRNLCSCLDKGTPAKTQGRKARVLVCSATSTRDEAS